jgi:hypothetical protein
VGRSRIAGPAVVGAVLLGVLTGCSGSAATGTSSAPASAVPRTSSAPTSAAPSASVSGGIPTPAHVVIVVEENKATDQVRTQPYLSSLAARGATFTRFRAERHPSEPNYLALWSGSTHGLTSDACPVDLGSAPSLGSQLLGAGRSVAMYAEGLPQAGYTGCSAGSYARKHNPLADFSATSGAAHNKPFTAFPSDYAKLPTVAMVIPDLDNDMHNGSIQAGDAWLEAHLGGYANWAETHNSVLVVTFDEDNGTTENRIATVVTGQHVRPGSYDEPVNHYSLLHTLERGFELPQLGHPAAPITDIWR